MLVKVLAKFHGIRMLARTHMVFGLVFLAIGNRAGLLEMDLVSAGFAVAGSLLPDIDHPGSAIGRRTRPLSDLAGLILGHRGFTHSLLSLIAWAIALLYAGISELDWLIAISLGYLSHLFGDWLTPRGVPLFWPRKTMYCAPFLIKTGGAGEFLLTLGILFLAMHGTFQLEI